MEGGISGVILAGGASSRFGGITKSNIVVDGETIISKIIRTVDDLFDELIIITNNPSEFPDLARFKIAGDHYLNAGPLGGIHSALKISENDAIFVFAGDMPFLNKEIITEQIRQYRANNYEILIPRIGRLTEPLHSVYRVSVLPHLERFLTGEKRSVRNFISEMNTGYMVLEDSEENKRAFTNINSQLDIERLK